MSLVKYKAIYDTEMFTLHDIIIQRQSHASYAVGGKCHELATFSQLLLMCIVNNAEIWVIFSQYFAVPSIHTNLF